MSTLNDAEIRCCERYPQAWHLTDIANLPSSRAHGLLSTDALLDLYGVPASERLRINARPRTKVLRLARTGHPDAVIRDQRPMPESMLVRALVEPMTVAAWCTLLNEKVFFFVDKRRREKLRARYPSSAVITVDTSRLIANYRTKVAVTRLNTGTVRHVHHRRGAETFQPIGGCIALKEVAELTVHGPIRDLSRYIVAADSTPRDGWPAR